MPLPLLIFLLLLPLVCHSVDKSPKALGTAPAGGGTAEDHSPARKGEPAHYRLERYLMANYNNRLIPRTQPQSAIQVLFTIGLYQIIEVNEPQQYILLNSWIVERWKDEMLFWDERQFEGIREIVLPRESVWIPDTTLYNSLVMDDAGSRRILNVKLNTLAEERAALVEMLYPTLYQFSCMLDLRFFPFDIQHCVMTFGSWTHDNKNIDYFAFDDSVDRIVPALSGNFSGPEQGPERGGIGIEHCIPNEGWNILSTEVARREVKFHCCAHNYTLLEFKLHIQRKPLFYLVNLIIPTSIITLIAIVGFFSSSTVHDVREEKISLGITTLLSMSILIFMVSDQMPSTSSFIPLIGWFYTSMMALISFGTLAASFVIYVQKRGIIGQRPSRNTMRWARRLGRMIMMEMPLLMKQAYVLKAKQDKLQKLRQQMELQQKRSGGTLGTPPRRPNWWQPRGWQARMGQQQQHKDSCLGPVPSALGRYRLGTNASEPNGRTGAFVGPSLGSAIGFLVPGHRKGTPPAQNQHPAHFKVSATESNAASVSFLDALPPAMNRSHSSINEEEDVQSGSSFESAAGEEKGARKQAAPEVMSLHSLNLIDMDPGEEAKAGDHGPKPEQPAGNGSLSAPASAGPNLANPLVANATVLAPLSQYAQTLLLKAQQRTQERLQAEVEARVLQQQAARKNSKPAGFFHRSTSSMADLYATSSLFSPTPLEGPGPDPGTTLAEASASLAALHPQVQRNLAEIEYDWLAAVLERMFLILFSSLFFLMSGGINGIGVYYWYFAYADMVEMS